MSPLQSRASEIGSLHRTLEGFDAQSPVFASLASEHLLRHQLKCFESYPRGCEFEYHAATSLRRVLETTDCERRAAIQRCLRWLEDEAAAISGALGSSNRLVSRASGRKSALARALGVLAAHPDWTDKRIAAEAGVSRTSLYAWPVYVRARAFARQAGKAHRASRAVRDSVQSRKRT